MNKDTKIEAVAALAEAFFADYSALVCGYVKAAKGLDKDDLMYQMGLSSVYYVDTKVSADIAPNIWTLNTPYGGTCGWDTLAQALNHPQAEEVHLNGKLVFKRTGRKWVQIGLTTSL